MPSEVGLKLQFGEGRVTFPCVTISSPEFCWFPLEPGAEAKVTSVGARHQAGSQRGEAGSGGPGWPGTPSWEGGGAPGGEAAQGAWARGRGSPAGRSG
jgi:hypothetical protein